MLDRDAQHALDGLYQLSGCSSALGHIELRSSGPA
jgi:hypothetical protein